MIFWLISGDYSKKIALIKKNPAAISTLILVALYVIGITYSSTSVHAAFSFGAKYHKLLFIPMIACTLNSEKIRNLALKVFLATSLFILGLSYLKCFGVQIKDYHFSGQGYVIFKGRIAHGIFMSFAMYMMLILSTRSDGYKKLIWVTLSVLAAINILFLVNGRTGQITMFALILWFTWETWRLKSLKYWSLVLLLGIGIHFAFPDFPRSRLTETDQEMSQGSKSSAGQRLEMYKNTLSLIQQHPFLGGGTGSLEAEYKILAENQHLTMSKVTNPHNQYLLTAQELGIVGLICLLWMWYSHWSASYRLSNSQYGFALRGLVITITVGSLFNSLILDAAEGQFYCVLAGILLSAYQLTKPNTPT
ncbi:MAG: O-antigen ligase family protein [Methylophilaceae bacterium]